MLRGELNDRRLVQRAKKYDARALGLLYERYLSPIYRYIRLRVGREEVAEDLTSEVFLKMLEAIGSFEERGVPFGAWLFRIAHARVVDYFRRATRETALKDGFMAAGGTEDGVEAMVARERLAKALGELTQEQQVVLVLKFGEELSNAEVGRLLGKSEGAIKSLQHRGLLSLRGILEEDEDGKIDVRDVAEHRQTPPER